jgi:hypothetical protein
MSEEDYLNSSFDILEEEDKKGMTINKANPAMFRELQYLVAVHPDVMNPRSEDLERSYNLEEFDRMVAAPPGMFDPEETARLLLVSSPMTKKAPDKYLAKQPSPEQQAQMQAQQMQPGQPQQGGGLPQAGNSPLASMMKKSPLKANASTTMPALTK